MSTDRELLELAAKAAGLIIIDPTLLVSGKFMVRHISDGRVGYWNARDDDGDSRRLQVACGIDSVHDPEGGRAYVGKEVFIERSDDRCAAMRRAVLRAAAWIVRSTKAR